MGGLEEVGLERKWKRVAEKGDNEGRETQIKQYSSRTFCLT